ncbi:MAG: TetR/AcrR family transcriptional regulator [Caulobacteraceae bacterium]|nr:TetR/AcrR family transcriptional regulator [Caulobacteraceae bacterium]
MATETRVRVDRDVRREAILDAAQDVFMEVGFAAASMSTIAARVGGSKGTLYNYFKSKEELFEAYVRRHCAWQQEAIMAEFLTPGEDIRTVLLKLGRNLLRVVLSEVGLRNFILVISEAHRAPEIGRAFYEAGPATGAERMAEGIAQATADGRLRPCEPIKAAHQFIGLCQNRMLKACLCNAMQTPTAEEIEAEVAAAVESFMAAFGPVTAEIRETRTLARG